MDALRRTAAVAPRPLATPSAALPPIDPRKIPRAEWNVFVHLNADNNLESFGKADLNEMEKVGSIKGKMNVFALVDGAEGYLPEGGGWTKGTRLLWVQKDPAGSGKIVSRQVAVDPSSDLGKLLAKGKGELNMADPRVLNAALRYVQARVPSKHTMVDLWDHGDAWRSASYDEKSEDDLKVVGGELSRAFKGVKVDIFSEDACLMATTEVAEVAKKMGAKYLVGSEKTEPGTGWNYTDVLGRMQKLFAGGKPVTAEQMAHAVVDSYSAGGKANATMSATNLARLPDLRAKMNAFSDALIAAGGLKNAAIRKAYQEAYHADYADQVDVGDFAKHIASGFKTGPLHDAAVALRASVEAACYAKVGKGNTEDVASSGLTAYAPTDSLDPEYTKHADPWVGSRWTAFIKTIQGHPLPARRLSKPADSRAQGDNVVNWV